MTVVWVVAAIVVVAVIVIVISYRIGSRLRRTWFAGTGLEEWRATARTLPWRDRWLIAWSVFRGHAAPRRLAALAMTRGEVTAEVNERAAARGSRPRRMWPVLAGLWALLAVVDVVEIAVGEANPIIWFNLVLAALLAVGYSRMPSLQRNEAARARRSVDLNRTQVGEGPTGRS